MKENWELIISQLQAEQGKLYPGDRKILNIESVIQAIRCDALESNYGHAKYFLAHPGTKQRVVDKLRSMIEEILPPAEEEQ